MRDVSREDPGRMAFLRSNRAMVEELLEEIQGYVVCANLNSYDQVVVAGETAAVKAAVDLAGSRGLDAQLLKVDRAFHSGLMSPCVPELRTDLGQLPMLNSCIPVPANISRQIYPFVTDPSAAGQPMSDVERRRAAELLCRQVDSPVDFISQVELAFQSGIRRFVEIGPKTVLTRLVNGMLQGKAFQTYHLDKPGGDVFKRLDGLGAALARPLKFHRRPLPTRSRLLPVLAAPAASDAPQSVPDQIRAIVSQVSGYEIAHIKDDAEFERDLGIDTLKIFEIIARLRGTVLPKEFVNYREATSVQKILAFASSNSVSVADETGSVTDRVSPSRVRCHRYQTAHGRLPVVPPTETDQQPYRTMVSAELPQSVIDLSDVQQIADPNGCHSLVVLPLPSSGQQLCEAVIPDLLQQFIELADEAQRQQAETEVHFITVSFTWQVSSGLFSSLVRFRQGRAKRSSSTDIFVHARGITER